MRGLRALIALTVLMGVLIVVGTTTLVVVVVHRIAHPRPAAPVTATPSPGTATAPLPAADLGEPAGTRVAALVRQSDRVLAIALTGGGRPDRLLLWDVAAGRRVSEITVGPAPAPAP